MSTTKKADPLTTTSTNSLVAVGLALWLTWPVSLQASHCLLFQAHDAIPHQPAAFTQGLAFYQDKLLESSGGYGDSWVGYRQQNGQLKQRQPITKEWFAEGITGFGQYVYLLTWRSRLLLQLDAQQLTVQQRWPLNHEGWGLTHDNQSLIISDGSNTLYWYRIDGSRLIAGRQLQVHGQQQHWSQLNELEFFDGHLLANQWKQDHFIEIDPNTGAVIGITDLSPLVKREKQHSEAVANGLAYHRQHRQLWLTGKNWSSIYRLSLAQQPRSQGLCRSTPWSHM